MRHLLRTPARKEQPVLAHLYRVDRETVQLAEVVGVQHLRRVAVRKAPVPVQQQKPVALAARKQQVVNHHDHHSTALAGLARETLEYRDLMRQIEMLQRFVDQVHARPLGE